MARVTVEDCIVKVPNRFDLVIFASQRARAVAAGAEITVDRDNDKNPVVALREIAEATVSADDLRESVIRSYQKYAEVDEPEEEEMEMLVVESLSEGVPETEGAPEAEPEANGVVLGAGNGAAEDEAEPGATGKDGEIDGTDGGKD